MDLTFRMVVESVLLSCLLYAPSAWGQTVQRDPVTGDYHVTYTALDGNEYTVVVHARDKVDPAIQVSIQRTADLFVYRYTLKHLNTPMAEQGIASFHLGCPLEDPALSMSAPPSWRAWSYTKEGRLGCSFAPAGAPLSPGQEVTGIELVSSWAPGMSVARVRGLAGVTVFESGEDTPRDVADLVNDLIVPTDAGNWRGVHTAAPSHRPRQPPPPTTDTVAALAAASSDADTWIGFILSDLDQTCELGWIDDAGVCSSLRTTLEQARAAVVEGDTESGRQHLQSFVAELEAQHGPGTPMHVNDNAYWLLKTNAEYVLSWM